MPSAGHVELVNSDDISVLECAPCWDFLTESKPNIFIDLKALMGCGTTNGSHANFDTYHKLHFVIITKIVLLHKQMFISFLHGSSIL